MFINCKVERIKLMVMYRVFFYDILNSQISSKMTICEVRMNSPKTRGQQALNLSNSSDLSPIVIKTQKLILKCKIETP